MKLNLPAYDIKLRADAKGRPQVYDDLRRKWVVLTPEEFVRQHFVHFLAEHRGYLPALMANEVGIEQNGCRRRCDTVVFGRRAEPVAIVEYKAPEIEITAQVFDQIVRYNMVLGVGVLMVSNGMQHYCCRIEGEAYRFLHDIPRYEQLL